MLKLIFLLLFSANLLHSKSTHERWLDYNPLDSIPYKQKLKFNTDLLDPILYDKKIFAIKSMDSIKSKGKRLWDTTKFIPPSPKHIDFHPIFRVPITDTTKPTYQRVILMQNEIPSQHSINYVDYEKKDFIPHRNIEDYFTSTPHTFLRDKFEYGQYNEYVINGLGKRYQHLFLDDNLLNDPITMKAVWQMLTAENFTSLSLLKGYESHQYSIAPISLNFTTNNFVASKGYTYIRFQDFYGKTTQLDAVFTLNLMKQLNFYGNYVIETNSGIYRNLVTQNNPFTLNHKVNIRFRYELPQKTYIILSGFYHELNTVPFGGINLTETLKITQDVFNTKYAVPIHLVDFRKESIGNLKVEFITPTFYIDDKPNSLKVYMTTSLFNHDYFIDNKKIDSAFSIRYNVGAYQSIALPFLSLMIRSDYRLDLLQTQNIIDQSFLKVGYWNTSVSAQSELNVLTKKDFVIKGNVSAQLYNEFSNNPYQTFLVGAGGEVNFKFINTKNVISSVFTNAQYTSRLSSLEEVYSNKTSLEGLETIEGLHNYSTERIFNWEIGGKIFYEDELFRIQAQASYLFTSVQDPIQVVQSNDNGTPSPTLTYHTFTNEQLIYQAISTNISTRLWKFELNVTTSYVLYYQMLTNLINQAYPNQFFDSYNSTMNTSSSRVFYIPKFYGNVGLYFRSQLFNNFLDLKIGITGLIMLDMSASLQNNELHNETYFNIYQSGNFTYDNNLAWGVQGYRWRMDAQLFAGFNRFTFYLFWENIFDMTIGTFSFPRTKYFTIPFFPETPNGFRFGVSWTILD